MKVIQKGLKQMACGIFFRPYDFRITLLESMELLLLRSPLPLSLLEPHYGVKPEVALNVIGDLRIVQVLFKLEHRTSKLTLYVSYLYSA